MKPRSRMLSYLLVSAAAAGCADNPSTPEPVPEASRAIQPLLVARPGLEDHFADIAARAPAFAGFYIGEDGSLYVGATRADRGAAVVAAVRTVMAGAPPSAVHARLQSSNLRVVRVDHSFTQLAQWRERITAQVMGIPEFSFLDLDEKENRIRIGLTSASAFSRVEAVLGSAGVPRGAVRLEVAQVDRPAASLQGYFRPLRGGLEIRNSMWVCTLGFLAENWSNRYWWETASHAFTNSHCTRELARFDNGGTNFGQLATDSVIGYEMFDPLPSNPPGCPSAYKCRRSDAALLGLSDMRYELGYIVKPSVIGSLLFDPASRFHIVGEGGAPVVGETLQRVGRSTGWRSGSVTQTCLTTRQTGTDIYFVCQDRFSAPSSPGDSGSPVFRITTGNDVLLYGLAWGGAETYTVFSRIGAIRTEFGGFNTY